MSHQTHSTQKTETERKLLAELVRKLQESGFSFAQPPHIITQSLIAQNAASNTPAAPIELVFERAEQLDSDGKLRHALAQSKRYLSATAKLVYALYFVLGALGVMALLGAQVVNVFYVLLALLGWHSLSLLWWCVSLVWQRPASIFGELGERLVLLRPILSKLNHASDPNVLREAFAVRYDTIKPVRHFALGKLLHGAWLASLLGAMAALVWLFLVRQYDFAWQSTLLHESHIAWLIGKIGALPAALGFDVPDFSSTNAATRAQFAWFLLLAVALYGLLPRFIAFMACAFLARPRCEIDTALPYYAKLLADFTPRVVDQDDFTPSTPTSYSTADTAQPMILAYFERIVTPTPAIDEKLSKLTIAATFGTVDERAQCDELTQTAHAQNLTILLAVSTHTLPDRGVLRKIDRLASQAPLAILLYDDNPNLPASQHSAWQHALNERNLLVFDVSQH
ncbi:hypothetical protein B0181_07440 [Moraxella caviae]|uniref:Uncharacterized membrane protein NMB1645 n=1 Tax=Moraxella caviae TaxID=34060 RepID=A0A1S9ZZQ5_9GAMM|nr:DUF2868 domain-containing protein [Moraxella caviae]OOR88995.1 hypothetical protein B0181_07440 [Moraxella caviae]STZ14749.1 Uncharacterized membrane protein NMB1645 [Moraxella caviae]VEW14005.1 Uncharacterized membrane protein NMB1645 [Moraxella caviae]